jgi:two-component system, sensor histidine kinase and response regulator
MHLRALEGGRPSLISLPDSQTAPTILVVDDNRANLLAAEALLAPLGNPLVTASSGGEALRLALAQDFVLILMDVHMPGLDGYETTTLLRQQSRSRDVPVIFLTAVYGDAEHTNRAYALGAADFISKPIDAAVLLAKIRALVSLYARGRRLEKERREESDRVKDLFLGAVGHDLRNPLHSIAMSAKLLRASSCPAESRQKHAIRIERAAHRMNEMIEDILDLTRGQFTGKVPVTLQPMDLGDVCRSVIDEFQVAHPTREVVLDVQGNVTGEWDAGRLARVVSNLVGNAIEHRPDVSVRVTLLDEDDRVALIVQNDGTPISADALPRLFEPFRRGDTSAAGLGLGLYIVREIVRAHGGSVALASTPKDGTSFTVVLPKQPGPRA